MFALEIRDAQLFDGLFELFRLLDCLVDVRRLLAERILEERQLLVRDLDPLVELSCILFQVGDAAVVSAALFLQVGDGLHAVVGTLAQVAQATLGPFALPLEAPVAFEPPERLFELPPLSHPLDIDFTGDSDHIRLAGYDLIVEDTPLALTEGNRSLRLTLWWVAQRQIQADYTVFVHLFDPGTEAIPVQHDAMPRRGSYPTSGWLPGEVVSDTVQLSLGDAPPGNYRLAVGLYVVATNTRLPPLAPDGAPLPDGRLVLPEEIKWVNGQIGK